MGNCGCNSNFDGGNFLLGEEESDQDITFGSISHHSNFFDGEDGMVDEDFDNLLTKKSRAKAKAKLQAGKVNRQAKRTENLSAKAERTPDYSTCINSKPFGISSGRWRSACSSVHTNTLSSASNPAVNTTPAKEKYGSSTRQYGATYGATERFEKPKQLTKGGSLVNSIKETAIAKAGELASGGSDAGAGMEGASIEPQKAGLMGNKSVLIIGGIAILGLGFFAYKKFRK